MGAGGGEEEHAAGLEYTPTWVVALVCTVIVAISLVVERLIHYAGKTLKKKNQKPLFEALQKVKEELMLLGFISLLLTVFQGAISEICIPVELTKHMLPCAPNEKKKSAHVEHLELEHWTRVTRFGRRLMSHGTSDYCAKKHKAPLLSLEAVHHLHIFIFVLAIVHVTFCVLTICFGGAKIRRWKKWEDANAKENYENEQLQKPAVTDVREHTFIRNHFYGIGKDLKIIGWLESFFKQFYASVTKSDYVTLRLGFIMTHCRGNPKFNFHKYMIRALEDDFKKVVGISWYLWVFVIVFLLLNVHGWHTYFWIAFIPLILLLAVGTKLEHVITQLAHEVAEKHVAIEGDLVVQPSDDHFWFHRPRLVLYLIHIILFQNAFEIAFFFWILVTYGWDTCIMGQARFIVPRLIIGVFIQVLCSYSTLPLYAIVTQMGSHYKRAIFVEHVQAGIVGWARGVKNKGGLKAAASSATTANNESNQRGSTNGSSTASIQMSNLAQHSSTTKAEIHAPGASQTVLDNPVT